MTRITFLTAAATSTLVASLLAVASFQITPPSADLALASAAIPCTIGDCATPDRYGLANVQFDNRTVTRSSSGLRAQPSEDEWTEIVNLVDSIEDSEWTSEVD